MHPSNASRIAAALDATPADYLARCLAQRCHGADACGSVFADYTDPVALLHALKSAAWEAYDHPAIMAGCTAFRAPFAGRVGIVRLDSLHPLTLIVLADPKHTGYVEAHTAGIVGPEADFAVVILGPDNGREVVYTFHPGAPIAPSRVAAEDMHGRLIGVADALALGLVWAKIVQSAR